MTVAIATVLLRHHRLIKCWDCHGSMETKFIHFEGIISHSHKGKVFLLIYLGFDVVLSRRVLHYINRMEQR